MCKVLKMILSSVVKFQKYYVIFKLLRNYWGPQLIFQSLSKHCKAIN